MHVAANQQINSQCESIGDRLVSTVAFLIPILHIGYSISKLRSNKLSSSAKQRNKDSFY